MRDGGKLKDRIIQQNTDWDASPPTQDYFDELFRVSKNAIIWGGNYFNLPPTRGIVCWDKEQSFLNFSQWEMAWTSFDSPASMVRIPNGGFMRPEKDKKFHPTQKPIALYEWLLNKYAKEGDTILDTHGGSMSSMIACHRLGFTATCCELDEYYFDKAVERIKREQSQLKLF